MTPDEIHEQCEDYDGSNSFLFQKATIKIVEFILDFAHKNKQSFILDGTLSSYDVAKKISNEALKRSEK